MSAHFAIFWRVPIFKYLLDRRDADITPCTDNVRESRPCVLGRSSAKLIAFHYHVMNDDSGRMGNLGELNKLQGPRPRWYK